MKWAIKYNDEEGSFDPYVDDVWLGVDEVLELDSETICGALIQDRALFTKRDVAKKALKTINNVTRVTDSKYAVLVRVRT